MAEPNEQAKNAENNKPLEANPELPQVESPPLSLADEMKSTFLREKVAASEPIEPMRAPFAAAPEVKAEAADTTGHFARPKLEMPHIKFPRLALPRFGVSPGLRRTVSLAATVMIAAGLGAAFGAAVNKRSEPAPVPVQRDAALVEENAVMQKSITRLTKELAALKTSVESANKDSLTRIGKLSDKLDRMPETTGSIGKQAAAVAPPPAAAAPQIAAPMTTEPTPLPQARPAIAQQDRRLPIVQGWTIYEIRNGMAWVENRGELFAAQPGVPLPGLGTVEGVKREGNQWVVVTAKGIISSGGENTAANVRPKPYYPPYYRPY